MITKSAKNMSYSSRLQECSKTSTAELTVTADVIKIMPEEAKKLWETCHRARKQDPSHFYIPALTTTSMGNYRMSIPSHKWTLMS